MENETERKRLQFMIIVETSAVLETNWPSILSEQISTIFKEPQWTKEDNAYFALIVVRDGSPVSENPIQCSPWITDYQQFTSWISTLKFREGASARDGHPLAEAICWASAMSRQRAATLKHVLLITNSEIDKFSTCKSCMYKDDAAQHMIRLAKEEEFIFSFLCPRQISQYETLFEECKPKKELFTTRTNKKIICLIRGLIKG